MLCECASGVNICPRVLKVIVRVEVRWCLRALVNRHLDKITVLKIQFFPISQQVLGQD